MMPSAVMHESMIGASGFGALLYGDGNLSLAAMVGPFLASALEDSPVSLLLPHDAPWFG